MNCLQQQQSWSRLRRQVELLCIMFHQNHQVQFEYHTYVNLYHIYATKHFLFFTLLFFCVGAWAYCTKKKYYHILRVLVREDMKIYTVDYSVLYREV